MKLITKIAFGFSGVLIISFASIGIKILTFPKINYQGNYDCAIILGAAVNLTKPSPVFKARIEHGIDLHQQGIVKTLIFTGGFGDGDTLAEGDAGAVYAETQGILREDILVERLSKTTFQNLYQAKKLMVENGLTSAIIVSDRLHLRRSMLTAKYLGIQAGSSATPYSKYKSWKTKIPFLLREIYFTIHFRLSNIFLKCKA